MGLTPLAAICWAAAMNSWLLVGIEVTPAASITWGL